MLATNAKRAGVRVSTGVTQARRTIRRLEREADKAHDAERLDRIIAEIEEAELDARLRASAAWRS
jgi:hypothetical protein